MTVDLGLDLVADDLRLRTLVVSDAALVVEATRRETGPAFWGPRPVGPHTLEQATTALAEWTPEHAQVSYGLIRDGTLLAAFGLMLDGPDSAELAYWVRPEQRRQGLASRGAGLVTDEAHRAGLARVWLEIDPANQASRRVAERCGYRYEQRLANHCRSWVRDDPAEDEWHDCLIWSHARMG
jgi:RimJ/RimL family protein N-acetyltransferase